MKTFNRHFKAELFRINIFFLLLLALLFIVCSGCSTTKIKYIQDRASTKLKLLDNTTLTAPSGKHYMLYLVNCIDNSKRNEGFFFTTNRLIDDEGQDTKVYDVPTIVKLVGTGQTETSIGQVVFEVPGPPDNAFSYLNYASYGTESVLMINQTVSGPNFGPAIFIVDLIDLSQATSSPYLSSDLCANKGSYHN